MTASPTTDAPAEPAPSRQAPAAGEPARASAPDVEIIGVTKRFGDVVAVDAMDLRIERGEFYSLLTFTSAGCMMLTGANDLVMVFIGLETLSLGVYAMTGFRRTNARSAEAAMKYFLLGSFAAAILLYASAMLYGITGHTDIPGIRQALAAAPRLEGFSPEQIATQQIVYNRIGVISMALVLVALFFAAVRGDIGRNDRARERPVPARRQHQHQEQRQEQANPALCVHTATHSGDPYTATTSTRQTTFPGTRKISPRYPAR